MTESGATISLLPRQVAGASPPSPSFDLALPDPSASDPITRLPGREWFEHAFSRFASIHSNASGPASMATFDVDNFRALQERAGETYSQSVLRRVGEILQHTLRRSDLLTRWEGHRFVALLPGTHLDGALRAAEKALQGVQAEHFSVPSGAPVRVTLSAGVTQLSAGATLQPALAACARYVDLAKVSGRGRILSARGEVVPRRSRVVVLEEDEPTASVIVHRLTRAGCEVVRVHGASELLSSITGDPLSLIILDLNSGDADGFGLLRRLRTRRALEAVPIVAISHARSEKEIIDGFRLGMDDFILKPFSTDELVARVQRLLKRAR